MKKHFMVSMVRKGLIGGALTAGQETITYRTGKVQIPSVEMKYSDIQEVTSGTLGILPTVTIRLTGGEEYKFVVFFGRNGLLDTLRQMGVDC